MNRNKLGVGKSESQDPQKISANQKNKTTRLPSGIGTRSIASIASDFPKSTTEDYDEGMSNREKFPLLPKTQKTESGVATSRNLSMQRSSGNAVSTNAYLAAKQRQHHEKMKQH
jgi:hypothetical protein